MFPHQAAAQPIFGMGASPSLIFIFLCSVILILIIIAAYIALHFRNLHKISDQRAKEIEISNQMQLEVQSQLKEKEHYIEQLQAQLMDQQKQSLEDREAISRVAYSDELTKLPNRHALKEDLQELINRPSKEFIKGAILFIDFDDFKNINDRYGHGVGDIVLYEVAQRIQDSIGNYGMAYRYESDEFIALIDAVVDADSIDFISEKLVDAFSIPIVAENHSITLNFSMGIAFIPIHGNTFETLLSNADRAMYHAKSNQESSIEVFHV